MLNKKKEPQTLNGVVLTNEYKYLPNGAMAKKSKGGITIKLTNTDFVVDRKGNARKVKGTCMKRNKRKASGRRNTR